MRKSVVTVLCLLMALSAYCQTIEREARLNLGFEKSEKGAPAGWSNFGSPNYSISLDSADARSGKYAASIEFDEGGADFKALAFTVPENYDGKKITLSGYIKTENVTEGYAGLWMRIDPSVAFDNMSANGIKGTTDWQRHEITLAMNPSKTEKILVGGLLVGKGRMWLDDLRITIDGNEFTDLKPYKGKAFPAENDKEFDTGSQIARFQTDKDKTDNLKTLGLVWGFLKYHHPNVAKGEHNWDYELFRVLPKVLGSESSADRDALLVEWIKRLGPFDAGDEIRAKPSEIKIEPDLGWITDSNLSEELTALLLKVRKAKRTEEHYYIGLNPGVGNPDFKNENPYSSMSFPDTGYRLLSLYRYWNIIQYYFPYKNLIEEDWKKVLEEFIPKFVDAENETGYTLAVLELIARVHDTHANVWGSNEALKNHFGLNYAAAELSFVEGKAVVTGFYDDRLGEEAGLEIGDIIAKVNNVPVEDIVKDRLKLTPASNYPTQLRDIAPNLLRTNDTIISIAFIREDKVENRDIRAYSSDKINLYSRFQVQDTSFKHISEDIAYINNGSLKRKHLPQIWEGIQDTKGVVIDIRNYPSDFPIYDLSSYLMPVNKQFVKFSKGSVRTPGLFTFTKPLHAGRKNRNHYKGKVVILVNEVSQSSAEFHAMAYRASPNATVIGSTTAGADGNVSQFYLPGGISTMISGIGVYYPDGGETQRVGIIPDIVIKPTVEGIRNGRDELMEKAIEIIVGQQ